MNTELNGERVDVRNKRGKSWFIVVVYVECQEVLVENGQRVKEVGERNNNIK